MKVKLISDVMDLLTVIPYRAPLQSTCKVKRRTCSGFAPQSKINSPWGYCLLPFLFHDWLNYHLSSLLFPFNSHCSFKGICSVQWSLLVFSLRTIGWANIDIGWKPSSYLYNLKKEVVSKQDNCTIKFLSVYLIFSDLIFSDIVYVQPPHFYSKSINTVKHWISLCMLDIQIEVQIYRDINSLWSITAPFPFPFSTMRAWPKCQFFVHEFSILNQYYVFRLKGLFLNFKCQRI